jgi:quinol monooxygenase YgiN
MQNLLAGLALVVLLPGTMSFRATRATLAHVPPQATAPQTTLPQPPPPLPGPASLVAYVDILPASRAQAIDAFRVYRNASRAEAGFMAMDIFEQQRRGAYFAVVETWASQAALDAHAKAPHTAALQSAMQTLAISGYDQRPYGGVSTAPARPTSPQAVYVLSHVDTAPTPGANPAGMLRALAEKSRTEPGNLRFDVLQHAMRRNHFTVIEVWESPAALDAHAASAHTKQYRLDSLPLLGSPLDERLFRAVE